jgi:hypothetical protein
MRKILGAEGRDEDVRLADLAGGGVDHRQRRPGVVDEQLFTRSVLLTHRTCKRPGVAAVMLDELGIAVGRLSYSKIARRVGFGAV